MPTPMHPIGLSETVAVGEAPTSAEIEILARAGFRSLINTQPEGELERQMPSTVCAAEAARHGLAYRYIPVESRYVSQSQAEAFAAALAELPKPVYAYCYSGARAAATWAMAEACNQDADVLIAACRSADFDISFLKSQLSARRVKLANAAPSPVAAAAVVAEATKPATPISAILPNGVGDNGQQAKVADVVGGKAGESAEPRKLPKLKMPVLPVPHRASA